MTPGRRPPSIGAGHSPTRIPFERPANPYTEALLRSVPDVRAGKQRLVAIEGRPPSIFDLPPGCPFAPRCPYVMPRCSEEFPPEVELGVDQRVSCWRHV